ncbi:MAG TPA: hypothetical protein VK467_11265, partial [Gemmatimonadales bacterium]|nr:hypothetical protein [Gemmatimonadales bacterium]
MIPLLLALAALGYAVVPLVDKLTLRWFVRDLDIRATLVANTVQDRVQDLVQGGNRERLLQYFTRITEDERLFAVGYCPATTGDAVATPTLPADVSCADLQRFAGSSGHLLDSPKGPILVSVRPLRNGDTRLGNLVLVHDMSFVARRSEETRKYIFYFFLGLGVTVALITVIIAQLSWRGWVQGLRALLRGEGLL